MASTANAPADPPVAADFPATLPLSLLAFHANVGPIYKASQAKYGAFADLQTVLEAVTPALLDQGLVLSQRLIPGPDGSTLLRTSLIHAPSGETLDSEWLIPNLDDLLGRVHALRQQVIERFPIDLPLAAAGALPFVMPPRSAAAAAADGAIEPANGNGSSRPALPAPSPDRPPGLRLDDQLKGLHTLLGQLGTTTNPLHSLGGVVTYCRRYQILSLLSLAAEDNDGEDSTQPPSHSRSAVPVPVPAPAQPQAESAGSRSRTRRSPKAGTEAPAPVPAPASAPAPPEVALDRQAAQPGAVQPQPMQKPAPQPAQPPVEQPSEPPAPQAPAAAIEPGGTVAAPSKLTAGQVEALIAEIRTLSAAQIPQVVAGFRHRFSIPATALVSDYIQTADHAVFLREQIAQLKQPVAL
jgi:hypothetical protein